MPGLVILSQRGAGHDHEVHRSRARVMPRRNWSGDSFGCAQAEPATLCGQTDPQLSQRLSEISRKAAKLQELKLQRAARVANSSNSSRDELVHNLLVTESHSDRFVLQVQAANPPGKTKSSDSLKADGPAAGSPTSPSSPTVRRRPPPSILAIIPRVIPMLLKAFISFSVYRTRQAAYHASQGSQGSPAASSSSSQRPRNTAGGKRKLSRQQNRDDGQDDGSNSDDEGFSRGKRSRTSPGTVEQHWACPFCKWKPLAYQACYAYVLKDISRVKQHLRRRHRIPIHCALCFESFSSEDKRDAHLRARCCEPAIGEAKTFEGVTREQQEMLERRVDKSKTKSDQWYSIYAILFPGEELPKSPFVDSEVSTHLRAFQDFVAEDGMQIVRNMASKRIPAFLQMQQEEILAFSEALFQHAVPALVQQFEATKGKAKEAAEPDSSPPIPNTPAMSLGGSGDPASGTESSFGSPPWAFETEWASLDAANKTVTGPGGQPQPLRDPPVVTGSFPGDDDGFGTFHDWTYGQLNFPDDLAAFEASVTNL